MVFIKQINYLTGGHGTLSLGLWSMGSSSIGKWTIGKWTIGAWSIGKWSFVLWASSSWTTGLSSMSLLFSRETPQPPAYGVQANQFATLAYACLDMKEKCPAVLDTKRV